MKTPYASHSHFIYEVDNIPDHRSRQPDGNQGVVDDQKEKPYESCNSHTANAK